MKLKKNSANKFPDKFDEVRIVVESRNRAERSQSSSLGAVYILPPDNMPCLVPNKSNAPMSVYGEGQWSSTRMPNAKPRKKIIPQDQ